MYLRLSSCGPPSRQCTGRPLEISGASTIRHRTSILDSSRRSCTIPSGFGSSDTTEFVRHLKAISLAQMVRKRQAPTWVRETLRARTCRIHALPLFVADRWADGGFRIAWIAGLNMCDLFLHARFEVRERCRGTRMRVPAIQPARCSSTRPEWRETRLDRTGLQALIDMIRKHADAYRDHAGAAKRKPRVAR